MMPTQPGPDVQQLLSRADFIANPFKDGKEGVGIDEAIELGREALRLCPPGHRKRFDALDQLAFHLCIRFYQHSGIDDIIAAIELAQEALSLSLTEHPERSSSLHSLGTYLHGRYSQLGVVEDLNRAITLTEEALSLRQPGHTERSSSLHNLGRYLGNRYRQLGVIEDLNKAIALTQDALSLRPPGHVGRSYSLGSLGEYLYDRYNQLRVVEDLNRAITLTQDTLSLRPPGHTGRSSSLHCLGIYLHDRYNQLGVIEDLNKAIIFNEDALSLRPPGHTHRPSSLHSIGVCLRNRYKQLWVIEDLNKAIALTEEALSLCPPGHTGRSYSLHSLGIYLYDRYEQLRVIEDLNKAITLTEGALLLRPLGHTQRSSSLHCLAQCLCSRLRKGARSVDKEELFSLYTGLEHLSQSVTLLDLDAANDWVLKAEEFHHPTTVVAYKTALRLLVEHLAALPSLPQNLDIFKSRSSTLAVDAFSACLRNQSPIKAVELFEQGRGVFWGQLARLRSPLEDVIASGPEGKSFADEFTRLTSLIRTALDSPSEEQHDRIWRLNLELQNTIHRIRNLPVHTRFLLPLPFSDLQRAACGGPVIITNVSKFSCDALILLADKDPVHIPLSITKEGVEGLSLKLRKLVKLAKIRPPMDPETERSFLAFLRTLWENVVSDIIDILQTICPRGSRIWWCPAGEFSLLPLHAASPFRMGQMGVPDLYISSYTTTLSALLHARRPTQPNTESQKKDFIAIGQEKASGSTELPFVTAELENIGQHVHSIATFTSIKGEESSISRVTEELRKNKWVHFACHGIPNRKQPFDSAFVLRDGRFTAQRIIQFELQNSEFAYLSACHTTVGDEESPDEGIHLASAMQFVGFRSVIGTMWAVDDSQTNKITSAFYRHLIGDSGCLDYTRAALALRRTIWSPAVKIPMDQRILYIHLGA